MKVRANGRARVFLNGRNIGLDFIQPSERVPVVSRLPQEFVDEMPKSVKTVDDF